MSSGLSNMKRLPQPGFGVLCQGNGVIPNYKDLPTVTFMCYLPQ